MALASPEKQIFNFTIDSVANGGLFADNADVAHILIPAKREVSVKRMSAYVSAASDGADFLELVKEDNTVICKVALQTTGHKSAVASDGTTATTFPQRVAAQSTTAQSLLKLRLDGATDAVTTVSVQIEITGL